jgi:hypothetical protein
LRGRTVSPSVSASAIIADIHGESPRGSGDNNDDAEARLKRPYVKPSLTKAAVLPLIVAGGPTGGDEE